MVDFTTDIDSAVAIRSNVLGDGYKRAFLLEQCISFITMLKTERGYIKRLRTMMMHLLEIMLKSSSHLKIRTRYIVKDL